MDADNVWKEAIDKWVKVVKVGEQPLSSASHFTNWWSETTNPQDAETCSKAIYVYPPGSKGALNIKIRRY